VTKSDGRRLSIFKRKILCKIYGPTYEREAVKGEIQIELEELYNEPSIVNIIKSFRQRWAGHVV
jgi:hypothetical protein